MLIIFGMFVPTFLSHSQIFDFCICVVAKYVEIVSYIYSYTWGAIIAVFQS